MRNRFYRYIYVLILLETLEPLVCHAKVVNDVHRTQRQTSVPEPSNSRDLQGANVDEQRLNEESADYGEETGRNAREKDDRDEASEVVVRLPRDVNAGLEKYTDQNERSSLYDDYEAKDVAKRGIPGGSEDYEEEDDDSSNVMEDVAAVRERELPDEGTAEERTPRGDARIKRDQSVSEALDNFDSSSNDPAKLHKSNIATKGPRSRQVSRQVESSDSLNDPASKIHGPSEVILDVSRIDQTAAVAPSERGESNEAEYEKRVEEEIQRKIDSIKEEIRRDVEAQRRINEIEENNAKFEELQNQEDDEDEQRHEREPIAKRQTKRSIRGNDNDALVVSTSNEGKRSIKVDQHGRELQRRSSETGKSDALKEDLSRKDYAKKRIVGNNEQVAGPAASSGRRFLTKKRDRVRQTFLVNDHRHRTNRRYSRSYASPLDRTGARPENQLFSMDQDLHSDLHMDNGMEENQNAAAAGQSNSLVSSLAESSEDLSPRLAKEYKEAFGGLQNEPGSALARFKRIKRALDAKISSLR